MQTGTMESKRTSSAEAFAKKSTTAARLDGPKTFSELIQPSTCLDDCLRERARERIIGKSRPPCVTSHLAPPTSKSVAPDHGPRAMMIDATRRSLKPEEREEYRCCNRLCLYCSKPGHLISACLARCKQSMGSAGSIPIEGLGLG